MTNLDALKAKTGYPLSENSFLLALENRGLDYSSDYSISNLQSLELAYADLISTILSSPNISEGGYSISLSERNSLKEAAAAIYSKYGQSNPLKKTAKFVQRW